jgi:hypothetical protein
MKLSRISISLYLTLIFLSGVAVGGFGHRLYTVSTVSATTTRKSDEWRKRYITEMRTRLNLRSEQVGTLNGILDETRVRFRETHEKIKPEMDAIKQQQVDKIRGMLDESQRAEYERMRQEREAREKAQGHKEPGI